MIILAESSSNNTAALVTPYFNNSLNGATYLEFDYNFREFSSINDSFYVEVFDSLNWQRVFSVSVDDCGKYNGSSSNGCVNGAYPHFKGEISAYANDSCKVRFVYHDGNNWGWHVGIDNVLISSPYDYDITPSELLDPSTPTCSLDSNHMPIIRISNKGTMTASNFSITINVDNGTQTVIDTITQSILPGDSLDYTFSKSVNLKKVGTYNLSSFIQWNMDQDSLNDSLKSLIVNDTSFLSTYSDGFETSPKATVWKTYGVNSSWSWVFLMELSSHMPAREIIHGEPI